MPDLLESSGGALNLSLYIDNVDSKVFHGMLGGDFKYNQTTKREYQEYYCFLVEQFYLDQYEASKVLFLPSY